MNIEKARLIIENRHGIEGYSEPEQLGEALDRVLTMIGNVQWCIDEYKREIEIREQDLQENKGISTGNMFKIAQKGVYGRAVADLTEVLDAEE